MELVNNERACDWAAVERQVPRRAESLRVVSMQVREEEHACMFVRTQPPEVDRYRGAFQHVPVHCKICKHQSVRDLKHAVTTDCITYIVDP